MPALVSALILLVELVLGVVLIGLILMGLAFTGEAYRNGLTPGHQFWVGVALVAAVLPTLVTLGVAGKRFLWNGAGQGVPLWIGLPFVVLVVCAGVSVLAMREGEKSAGRTSAAKREAERVALRAKVEGGATELACDLVLLDPDSTKADMARCRARIESLADPSARWTELAKFTDEWRGFHSWNPAQVGFTPVWDWNGSVVAVRHDQEWFLRTFYETWLARPDALQTPEDRKQLEDCVSRSGTYAGWRPAVAAMFAADLLPKIEARLSPEHRSSPEMTRAIERATSTETRTGPAVPPPPAVPLPPDAIGLARFDADGTLHLWFRSTPTDGDVGDVYLGYSGSWDGPYEPMLKHLGKPSAGAVVPIPPITESDR